MKIYRQHVKLATGMIVFAYVRANWFERRQIDKTLHRRNMAKAYNWPAPQKFRAHYTLAPKGGMKVVDLGPCPNPMPGLLEKHLLVNRPFTWLDLAAIGAGSALYPLYPKTAVIGSVLVASFSIWHRWWTEKRS